MPLGTGDCYLLAHDLRDRPIGALTILSTVIPPGPVAVLQPGGAEAHKVSDDALIFPNACRDCMIRTVAPLKGRLELYNHF